MPAGAPKGNKNAERWTEEEATKFFATSIELARTSKTEEGFPEYDFIGELTTDLGEDKHVYSYLVEKFPQFEREHKLLLSIIESNCFRNIKRGKIKEASGIINLKSNYKWSDRLAADHTTAGEKIEGVAVSFVKP